MDFTISAKSVVEVTTRTFPKQMDSMLNIKNNFLMT